MKVAQRGIDAMLAARLLAILDQALMTEVDTGDDSRADVVMLGKPTTERRESIVVSVQMDHPLGLASDRSERIDGKRTDGTTTKYPQSMGSERRGIEAYFGAVQLDVRVKKKFQDTLEIISSLKRRIIYALDTAPSIHNVILEDGFGNKLIEFETLQVEGASSGGTNTQIHREWISFRMVVSKPLCAPA